MDRPVSAGEYPGGDYDQRVPAEAAALGPLLEDLEAYAEAQALGPRLSHHLLLLAEEVAANVVMHAAGASFVGLRLRRSPGTLLLVVEDDGPAFDPLALAAPDTAAPLEDRDAGGLGVLLVRRLSRAVTYARDGAVNRLSVVMDAPDPMPE